MACSTFNEADLVNVIESQTYAAFNFSLSLRDQLVTYPTPHKHAEIRTMQAVHTHKAKYSDLQKNV